jgi:hypothetical protein
MEYKEDDDDDEELLAQNFQLSIYLNASMMIDQKFDTFVSFEYCCDWWYYIILILYLFIYLFIIPLRSSKLVSSFHESRDRS